MDGYRFFYCPFCGRGFDFQKERINTAFTCPLCLATVMRREGEEGSPRAVAIPITEGESFARDGFTVRDGMLISYVGNDSAPRIPEGVVAIGEAAFKGNRTLREIVIPESVKYIGHSAFAECEGMRRLTLPKDLVAIGNCAFESCRRLERVKIPKTLRAGGYAIFNRCDNLAEADFPMDMVYLGGSPHSFCRRLLRSQVPHCVQSITHWIADNDALESLTLGRRVHSIDYPLVSPRLCEVYFTQPEGWAYTPCNIPWDGTFEAIDPAVLAHPKKAAQFLKKLQGMRRTIRRIEYEPEEPYYLNVEE